MSKPSSVKCPPGPAKSRLERVRTCREKKRLEREEKNERMLEERKELGRLERERRRQELELSREAAEVVEEEGKVDVSMEQDEHVATSWTAETPYGAMGKTTFYDYRNKLAALLQKYPVQEQIDLMMNMAAARSLPTLECPLQQKKMRMTVSGGDLSKFLKTP